MYETAQTSAWRCCRVIRVRADLGLERNDIRLIYTVSQKKQDTKLLPITSPNVNRFSKFFHW